MYHPPSKKKAMAARVLTYTLMSVSVVTLVTVSLLYTLGYRFDTEDKQLELSGLVQFATTPTGATVEIDGVKHDQITPTKETVTSGSHEFVMWREGYETWRKTVLTNAGTLTWLNYARLVPKIRTVESVASISTLAQTLASPDKRFMAAVPDASKPVVSFYDLTADTVSESSLVLTSDSYSDASTPQTVHHFELDQWDQNGRYLLVKHTYSDKVEWLVIDRQDGKMVANITRTFDMAISQAVFADNSATVLYAMVDGNLRKINLREATVSAPLVSSITEFDLYSDVIGYVHTPDPITGKRQVGLIKDGKEPVSIYTSTSLVQVPVHIALSHYFNKDYAIVSDGAKVIALSGSFPTTQTERSRLKTTSSFVFSSDVGWLQMSPAGRFIIVQNAASYAAYDLERGELSPVATLAGTTIPREVDWLDDYYVWSDRSDTLTMREFDGANQHTIAQVVTGFDATLSQNGRWLYTIGKHASGHYQLQRVRMILL
ncbi:MAG: hypothetical protein JWM00_370 [Candidatus Saccharibacteria bacterium]|nr:hypothetical protein [Candidatus Saccharibacteria bacterium]